MSGALSDRRILVTGGSSGIGAAVAKACADEGAAVAVLGRDLDRLDRVAAGCGGHAVAADVADPTATRAAVEGAATALGGLDGVVNAAGVMLHSALSAGRFDDWRVTMEVNVLGVAHVWATAKPHLADAGYGDVVNVASLASDRVGHPDFALYAASKAAVASLTDAMRAEIDSSMDVRVSMIKPGATRTPGFGPGIRDPELRATVTTATCASGMEPALVAEQIRHLIALPRSACITELTLIPHRSKGSHV